MSEIVYFDSCVFLAWLKGESDRVAVIHQLFDEARDDKLKILISTLTMAEVLNLQTYKSPIPVAQREQVRALFHHPWIVPKAVNRRIAELSQDLVWEYGVNPKDGIHVATAMIYEVCFFYTYDEGLLKKGILTTSYGKVIITKPKPPIQGKLPLV